MKNVSKNKVVFARYGAGLRRAVLAVAVALVGAVAVMAQSDANQSAVTAAASTVNTTFGTIFAIAVGIVIALVARKYLRKV